MDEYDSLSVSSYEASSLAAKLTEKSGEGWDVVAIVPTGSEVTAYLKRASGGTAATSRETSSTATEPAGWGTAPESTQASPTSSWGATGGSPSGAASGSSWGASTDDSGSASWGAGASSGGWGSGPQTPSQPAAASTPSVPPGWYADPAGRYELRYWDGSAWTEHVSRAGQQYTDPPVA